LQRKVGNLAPPLLKCDFDTSNWVPQDPKYTLQGHRATIYCIAFHPEFFSIATGSEDFTIREEGEMKKTLNGHTRAVRDVDFGCTSSGVLLASCSSDLTIELWIPTDDYKSLKSLQGHEHIVSAVRFIPSRNLLASASRDTDERLWDVTNGYCAKTIQGHTEWVRNTLRLSIAEDKLAAIGHENRTVCCAIVLPASFRYLAAWTGLKGSSSPAGFMATGARDKIIKL
ncbi:dynein regulator, partial [Penicillium sp. IBT 18751x]